MQSPVYHHVEFSVKDRMICKSKGDTESLMQKQVCKSHVSKLLLILSIIWSQIMSISGTSNFYIDLEKYRPSINTSYLMYTTMTPDFAQNFQHYTKLKHDYANSHDHVEFISNISDFKIDVKPNPVLLSLYAAINLLDGNFEGHAAGREYDWIVKFDTDMFIAEKDTPLSFIEALANRFYDIHRQEDKYGLFQKKPDAPLWFIAQDQHQIINAGFYMIKNCTESRLFLKEWAATYIKYEEKGMVNFVLHDQGTLMNTVLQHVTKIANIKYEYHCLEQRTPALNNECWSNEMEKMGLLKDNRMWPNFVLMPLTGVPFQVQEHGTPYKAGNFLWHHKNKNYANGIKNTHYFSFDHDKFMQIPLGAMVAKVYGWKNHEIYLVFPKATDNTDEDGRQIYMKASIPDLDTVNSFNNIVRNRGIVELNPIYFDTLRDHSESIPSFDLGY